MKHLATAHILPEDMDLFRVREPGWYAFDDDHVALLGPFNSREECEKAIRSDRNVDPGEAHSSS
jgi:hypothetical protein